MTDKRRLRQRVPGLKQLLPSGYTAAKVYALILFFGEPHEHTHTHTQPAIENTDDLTLKPPYAATVLTAIILRAKEPKIDAKYFQVQCTGIYKDRWV
jgi:hypothetical protein